MLIYYYPEIEPTILPFVLAVVLSATAANELIESDWYTVTDLRAEGKGLGAIARKDIPRGTKLLAERPLAIWPQGKI